MFERILKQLFSKYFLPLKCFKPILSFRGKFHCCKIGFGNNLLTCNFINKGFLIRCWKIVDRQWKNVVCCKNLTLNLLKQTPPPWPIFLEFLHIFRDTLWRMHFSIQSHPTSSIHPLIAPRCYILFDMVSFPELLHCLVWHSRALLLQTFCIFFVPNITSHPPPSIPPSPLFLHYCCWEGIPVAQEYQSNDG